MRSHVILGVIIFAMAITGCSRMQKVIATPEGASMPYESLGVLEVKKEAPAFGASYRLQQTLSLVSFRLYEKPSQEAYFQKLLDKELVCDAKKKYGADAVIHVKYWPDLNAAKFPKGLIYAKGEMIRYKQFSEEV